MRASLNESLLKGIFLGMLFYVSLIDRNWDHTSALAWGVGAGIAAGLVIALLGNLRDFLALIRKPQTSLLFLILENPLLVYAGAILGLAGGWVYAWDSDLKDRTLWFCLGGGIVWGYGLKELRSVADWRYRLGILLAAGIGLVYGVEGFLDSIDPVLLPGDRKAIGLHLLLGLPVFYLLVFASKSEEADGDFGTFSIFLGLALFLIEFPKEMKSGPLVIAISVFFIYLLYILPGLRPFKHSLRGVCYLNLDKIRPAIISFRKALELDSTNRLAHEGMEAIHLQIDIDKHDAATLGLLDRNLCLNRVRSLVRQKPTESQRIMAERFLKLVEGQWPKWLSHVIYFRAVLAVHAGDFDRGTELLSDLLTPEGWFANDAQRKAILFEAWQLVLLVHPVLKERVGEPQLRLPGRRMEAIGAVERQIALLGKEPALLEFQAALYRDLQVEEFQQALAVNLPVDFSYALVEKLGVAMIDDPQLWRRGAEFLRMAVVGLPEHQPTIYAKLADAHAKSGESVEADRYRLMVRDAAIQIGLERLAADQKKIYFSTVKRLADEARSQNQIDEAIYNFSLATHCDDGIKETLRALAEMYEKKQDVFNALRVVEKALLYDSRDPDLLAKKDKYYYSLEPDILREATKQDENVRKYFDVDYCIRKAKQILDAGATDNLDNLDWAQQLLQLVIVMQPSRMAAMAQLARCLLRRGERMEAVRILEDIREVTPSGAEESDAWYFTQKQLGLLYLDELHRPDLAIGCLAEYVKHIGSGAQSLYDLGRAYEAAGKHTEAIKSYNQVTAYEDHPLRWEAKEAIRRIKEQVQNPSTIP